MQKILFAKVKESTLAVLPITLFVTVLAVVLTDIEPSIILLFIIGALLLIVGITFFTLGAYVAMMPIGTSMGSLLASTGTRLSGKNGKFSLVMLVAFIIGFVVTIAEPNLLVFVTQLGGGNVNLTLLFAVAGGVGIFTIVSILRTLFGIRLSHLLIGSYILVFALGIALHFKNPDFLALAFDSGGVTTGSLARPFIMAIGLGIASVKGAKSGNDSFGMVGLCSVGPIITVMILGLTGRAVIQNPEPPDIHYNNAAEILRTLGGNLGTSTLSILLALTPIIVSFAVLHFFVLRLPKKQIIRIAIGIGYTFVGLTVFLTGASVGFEPMGYLLGLNLAQKSYNYMLIPFGMVMGCLIVFIEPGVLYRQVEEVTGGAVSRKVMVVFLCIGVTIATGLSMLRILTGISIWYFIVPVYAIALILMFVVPRTFTCIAFDCGGVATGPITTAFMLPLAIGACTALGGEIFRDAYGLVAFVAMTPLVLIQVLGLIFKVRTKRLARLAHDSQNIEEDTVDFEDSENTTIIDDIIDSSGYSPEYDVDTTPLGLDNRTRPIISLGDKTTCTDTSGDGQPNRADTSVICKSFEDDGEDT